MPRPIQSRVLCYFSFIQFPQISKQTALTHFKIWANLFPVWTYSGRCHYSGSKYNMFEVWRWSGGWRGPSRWARRLLRAAEWERKEDASQQARQLKMSGSGASNSRLTHGVGLHRSRGWAWHTEIHQNLSSVIVSICPFVIIRFSVSGVKWSSHKHAHKRLSKCVCVLLSWYEQDSNT